MKKLHGIKTVLFTFLFHYMHIYPHFNCRDTAEGDFVFWMFLVKYSCAIPKLYLCLRLNYNFFPLNFHWTDNKSNK